MNAEHQYNQHGFCKHCGWERQFIEKTGRPCAGSVLANPDLVTSQSLEQTMLEGHKPSETTESKPPQNPPGTSSSGGDLAPMSGIVAGLVMAYTRSHYTGVAWILPTGVAYGFCIAGFGPFRFSWTHRIIATVIMFVIGFYGEDILHAFMSSK